MAADDPVDLPDHLADYDAMADSMDHGAGTDPTTYSHHARRAQIWKLCRKAGSPSALNQTELANRYGVSKTSIYRDFRRLAEYVELTAGDGIRLRARSLVDKAVDEYVAAGEYDKAWSILSDWLDFLVRTGAVEEAPARLDVSVDDARETESYVLVNEQRDERSADEYRVESTV